jgi:hypothetical protein
VRQPFLITDRAQVLVDPQQDVCDQVLGSVRVGDPAAHERPQLRDDLPPHRLAHWLRYGRAVCVHLLGHFSRHLLEALRAMLHRDRRR